MVKQAKDVKLPLIWGARAIADALGIQESAAEHMLTKGAIRGARKIGGRWTLNTEVFLAQFKEQDDE